MSDMETGQGERRNSGFLVKLERAHQKINTLEDFIRDRERQFHVAVNRMRLERRDSRQGVGRLRRVGHADVLLRMRSSSIGREESDEDLDIYLRPLGEYVCLQLLRVLDSADSDDPVPFILRRLVSRQYHVGPEGATIGTSDDCTVCVPKDSRVLAKHLGIRWTPGGAEGAAGSSWQSLVARRGSKLTRQEHVQEHGHFILEDLTGGGGVFYTTYNAAGLQRSAILEAKDAEEQGVRILSPDSSTEIESDGSSNPIESNQSEGGTVQSQSGEAKQDNALHLTHGIRFVTGQLEWSITALPLETLLTLKMFAAARKGNMEELRSILDSNKCSEVSVPYVFVTLTDSAMSRSRYSVSMVTEQGLDVNVEYQPPSYAEDYFFNQLSIRRRSSSPLSHPLSPLSPSSPSSPRTPASLLLHIAIDNGDLEMTKYLLEKGADPNRCSGELEQNALHLAAHANSLLLVQELLRYGGDVEVRDARHLQPLALTNNYEIRKLLLGTVLLCAAAEAGDYNEVERLLSTTACSPNACGLRHKNALHLASSRGHKEVVEFLIVNGVNVNARGGSRQRSALHYASLNNHVAVATVLLEAGANEFSRDSGGYTPLNLCMGGDMCKLLHKQPLSLCLAVQSGDLDAAERILGELEVGEGEREGEGERVVDQRNQQSHAPLHLACTAGNIKMSRVLVSHGADVNLHGGSDSWTPLFYAAMAGHEPVVEFLLSVGASTEEVDCHGNVVQERVEQAMEEIKERLVSLEKKGRAESVVEASMHTLVPASMTRQESATSCSVESERVWLCGRYDNLKAVASHLTPGPEKLLKAMDTRNLSKFINLLETGAVDPNVVVDKYCPTPALVRACEDGRAEFAEALLKYGANPSTGGTVDQIPLLVAAGNGHTDIVQLLVQHGANVNTQSSDTLSSPLHEAAATNSLPTVEFLLSAGANLKSQNIAGETPFDCTTLLEIQKLLASGPYQLLVAASVGDHSAVTRLINEEGISPSHEFPRGITALHEACEGGHVEAAQVLVDLGADVNKQTYISQLSPLHLASQHNHTEVARLLLKAGAKLDAKDSEGKVPFEVACTNQMRKVLVEARSVKAQPVRYSRESSSERKCMICMDNVINTIILPCGHQAFCTNCVSRITECALDRQTIREVITIFK